jgi:molecular chaperone DnaK (HSP70)
MSTGAYQAAIDFGTTNTVACVLTRDAPPQRVKFGDDWRLPSAVLWSDASAATVGTHASNSAVTDPTRFLRCPKREIGHSSVELGGRSVPVVDVVAAVLATVREELIRQYGAPPTAAVLTRPVQWAESRQDLFASAARAAGFADARFLEEPVAAAIQVGQLKNVAPAKPFAVLDFGGGTLDVAVIVRNGTAFDVLASGGVDPLGGEDIDDLLFSHVMNKLEQEGKSPELRHSPAALWVWRRTQLLDSCRRAKEQLSTRVRGAVQLPDTGENVFVTRPEFDGLIEAVVGRAVETVRYTVDQSGFARSQVPVYLVGGSSPVAVLTGRLEQAGFEVRRLGDPQFVVSEGAALWVAGRPDAQKGRMIFDGGMDAIREYHGHLKQLAADVQRRADEAQRTAREKAAERLRAAADGLTKPDRPSLSPAVLVGVVIVVVVVLVVVLANL